jgi:hypothetical protein
MLDIPRVQIGGLPNALAGNGYGINSKLRSNLKDEN